MIATPGGWDVTYSNCPGTCSGVNGCSDWYDDGGTAVFYVCSTNDEVIDEAIFVELRTTNCDFYKFSGGRIRHAAHYALLISLIFNVYKQGFYRKTMFPKSGFIGRVAKRRKA